MSAATVAAVATVAGTAYGAYSANKAGKDARKAAKNGNYTNQTTTSTPYGPTIDPRQQGLDAAMNLFNNYNPQFNPYRPKGGGPSKQTKSIANAIIQRGLNGSGVQNAAEGSLTNILGGLKTQATGNPNGLSYQDIVGSGAKRFANLPKDQAVAQANAFAKANPTSTLGQMYAKNIGQASGPDANGGLPNFDVNSSYNPMLTSLWNQGASSNPYLDQFLKSAINNPAFNGGDDSGGMGGGNGSSVGTLDAEGYLKDIANGKWLDQQNPYTQKLIDQINARATDAWSKTDYAAINSQANKMGRFGSLPWQELQASSADKLQQNLLQNATGIMQGEYDNERGNMMSAVHDLSGIDVSKLGEETKRMGLNQQNSQNRLASLLGAIGQYSGDQGRNQSYLGSLAGQYSNDLLSAQGLAPATNAMGLQGLQAAQGASHGIDAAQAAASERQRQYDIAKWNFDQNAPFARVDQLGQYINMFGGGYGSTNTEGTGNGAPYLGPSQAGMFLGGALQGGQTVNDLYHLYQAYQGGQVPRGGVVPPGTTYVGGQAGNIW